MTLVAGSDFRLPSHRREVWLRFYEFHLRYGTHPGCVHLLLPYLAEHFGWTDEEALWFAFINGNTQHPPTSLLIHRAAPSWQHHAAAIEFWRAEYDRLAFDTDRRYHKKAFDQSVLGYVGRVERAGSQTKWWRAAERAGWPGVWAAAQSIPTMGRLSAWSWIEYVRILGGVDVDAATLMLDDRSGSRSHRNGLCIVLGLDGYDWHESNPSFNGNYPKDLLRALDGEAHALLAEAQQRFAGRPFARDVGFLTMESALCTYKSWHRPNRRYPNVYADMLHDRLVATERTWPDADLGVFWQARADRLPSHLLLERNAHDPGVHPMKQNHYRTTGQVVMMNAEWECFTNDLNDAIASKSIGPFR